VYEEGIFVIP
jgi:hypothetical protein